MPISGTCPACGKIYQVPDDYLGNEYSCPTCGSSIILSRGSSSPIPAAGATPVPAPAAPQTSPGYPDLFPAPAPAPPTISYRSLPFQTSKERKLASRICITFSVLMFLGGTCLGLTAVLGMATLARGGAAGGRGGAPAGVAFVGIILFALLMLVFGFAVTYLVCGIKIRKPGTGAPIVALIVASIHVCGSLLGLLASAVNIIVPRTTGTAPPSGAVAGAIAILIYLLLIAALAQLIYYLIKILREPR